MFSGLNKDGIRLEEFAEMCQGKLFNAQKGVKVFGISTDTRSVQKGEAFFAIKGEIFDGNKFVGEAEKHNASCAVVSCLDDNSSLPQILVKDTVEAMCSFAKKYKSLFRPITVAITGSVGKTTTKQYTHAILSTLYSTLKTEGNLNSEIGLPITLSHLTSEHKAAVVEMGMSSLGDIRRLSEIAEPDISIITNIGCSHLEYLQTRDNILKAKMEIIDGMKDGSILLLNGDNEYLRRADCKKICRLFYGINENNDYVATNIRMGKNETLYDLITPDDGTIKDLKIMSYGYDHIYDSLAAVVCGILFGLSDDDLRRGLLEFKPVKMRKNIRESNGVTVIEDYYNACPESMKSALEFLNHKTDGRKTAILGDMKELGKDSPSLHSGIGKAAVDNGVELLFAIGDYAEDIKRGAEEEGIDDSFIFTYKSTDEFIDNYPKAKEYMRQGDCVLIKASRSMHFERISELM